jgi:hypothetical protein
MQPPLDPEDVGVRVACLTGVVFTAPRSPSRLRRLSQWGSMVTRPSSHERWRSSLAYKSIIERLADSTSASPERFTHRPP